MHEFDVPGPYRYYKVILSRAKHFQLLIVVWDFPTTIATEMKKTMSKDRGT